MHFVGSLLRVGAGAESPDWIAGLLAARDRTRAAATASAAGLYLVGVDYLTTYALPTGAGVPPIPLGRGISFWGPR